MSHKDWPPSRLAAGQKALERYVRTRAAISTADRVAVVSFDTEASTDVPLTSVNNRNSIIKAAMKLKANGGTDIAVGLEAAVTVLANPLVGTTERRLQKILLLTDGKGGRPLSIAEAAKSRGITIDVVGIGGKPSAVDEPLLRKVATTDADGHNHYQFIGDSADLTEYYQHLATSLVWRHDSE